jgi:hypothetical protein
LHNEELHNAYSSPNVIRIIKSRRMRWAGHVSMHGKRNAYKILVGKPEGKKPLGRPRHRQEDNIRMDLTEIGWKGVEWICLAQGLVVGSLEHNNEPSGSIKGREFLD